MFRMILFFIVFFTSSSAFAKYSNCFENRGAYVANVRITYEYPTHTKNYEKRHMLNGSLFCLETDQLAKVTVRVEHYMFLGNATLRHTCTRVYEDGISHLFYAEGTTVNYRCVNVF